VDETEPQGFREPRPAREPMFNAPWTITVLCLGLIGLYALQSHWISDGETNAMGDSAAALRAGQWGNLILSLFLHGSWPHVLLNSVAALAFGAPVARLMGTNARGAAAFFAFYLACGILAGLGFVVLNLNNTDAAIGASGAISGLLGAASRLIEGRGRIGPMFGRTVIAMAVAWTIANVLLGISGLTPGAAGMPVAWQAHLVGFAAGVLLIGPFARLAGRSDVAFTQ
jgi:membrane associated rhomboid family serine protease